MIPKDPNIWNEESHLKAKRVVFYIISSLLLLIQLSLILPSATILEQIGSKSGQGVALRVPLLLLLGAWIYSFIQSRSLLQKGKTIASYGWLIGSNSLIIVMLLMYMQSFGR